jgi:hypothetical protein
MISIEPVNSRFGNLCCLSKKLKAILPTLDGIFNCPHFVLNNTDRYNLYYDQDFRDKILEISKGILFARTWKYDCFDVKLIRYQFCCTRCAFRLLKSLQWYSGRKGWKSGKKKLWKVYKSQKIKWLSQICRRIELCMRKIILCFQMNL